MKKINKVALLVVDVQNDFCGSGALAVPDAEGIIDPINTLILIEDFNVVIFTQDWHPADHGSFASNNNVEPFTVGELDGKPQIMWPDHCVQESRGAEFHSNLFINPRGDVFVTKGMDKTVDSYSAFYDNNGKNPSGLVKYLQLAGITHLVIVGLAADYCVKFTVLDALNEGFGVSVVPEAIRAMNMNDGDYDLAIEEMIEAGANIVNFDDVVTKIHKVRYFNDN